MIVPARLAYTRDGTYTPFSESYQDVYHSTHGGAGQARHVFLAGNGLPERWQARERFLILETGFGLGLNFLATCHAWQTDPKRSHYLHYVALEKHPFTRNDLQQIHRQWPEFARQAEDLQQHWPPLTAGIHRLHLDQGRIWLDLVFGDAQHYFPQLTIRPDAIYLDGFSPTKNPDLWDATLLRRLSASAQPGTTLSTWCVAGLVRETLAQAGWQLTKVPGFSGKRDMLRGEKPGVSSPKNIDKKAIVIGAGLAGSSAANRLAARGWKITLLDSADQPACGASGNHAGVLRPQPSPDDNPLARATRNAFLYTRRHLETLEAKNLPLRWGKTGALHLARDKNHEISQRQLANTEMFPKNYLRFVECLEAQQLSGWPVDIGGWWFPQGAWVSPRSYCQAQLLHYPENIRSHFNCRVNHLRYENELWQLFNTQNEKIAETPQLVIANATDANRLLGEWLNILPARGQVSHLTTAPKTPPYTVVCRAGYVTPEIDTRHYIGATLQLNDPDPELRDSDHAENLRKLQSILPGFEATIENLSNLDGRVGFRPTTSDRLPLVGPVPAVKIPGLSPTPNQTLASSVWPGLWLINGFGARGITWSAFAGELLADHMENTPPLLENKLVTAFLPQRLIKLP